MDKDLGIKYSFKQRCFESRFKSTKSNNSNSNSTEWNDKRFHE